MNIYSRYNNNPSKNVNKLTGFMMSVQDVLFYQADMEKLEFIF